MLSLIIGITAGIICAVSFIPQVVKIFRTKNADDLSVITFSAFALGIFLWLVYGLMVNDLPVIFANLVTLSLVVVLLALKIKYAKSAKRGDV